MWFYWLLFSSAVPSAIFSRPKSAGIAVRHAFRLPWQWLLLVLLLAIAIGFRYEVGGDWFTYLKHLAVAQGQSISEVFAWKDPGYQLVNWVSAQLDLGISGTNFVCGLIFSIGLAAFCRSCPRPSLAFLVSIPYLVIVIGMGYTRQGVALGLFMIALVHLGGGRMFSFILWVMLAAFFHKSAVVMIPIAALASSRNRLISVVWVAAATLLGYETFLEASVDDLYYGYIEKQYQSEGALIRLLMNATPAFLLLCFGNRFAPYLPSFPLWRWLSLISIALLAALWVSPSSTAVDRIGLYMIPLQLMVLSALPDALRRPNRDGRGWAMLVVLYSLAVQFVWLNFANHARAWIPYDSYIFQVFE